MSKRSTLVYRLQSQRTSLITILASFVVALVGAILILLSNTFLVTNPPSASGPEEVWRILTRDLGSLLVVTVALALVWELSGKRSFADEVYSKANLAQSIQAYGLQEMVSRPEDINWEELFKNAHEIDLFFAYNAHWRTTHEVRLRDIARRKGARIRLILPDVTNSVTVEDLARRFAKTPDKLKARVQEATEQFEELAQIAKTCGAVVEIYAYGQSLHYSLYRFDNTYIFALYNQRTEKTYVPHFICCKGGELAKFFDADLQALVTTRYSRRIV